MTKRQRKNAELEKMSNSWLGDSGFSVKIKTIKEIKEFQHNGSRKAEAFCDTNNREIWINKNTIPYTIAHEIAHAFQFCDESDTQCESYSTDRGRKAVDRAMIGRFSQYAKNQMEMFEASGFEKEYLRVMDS